MDARHGRKHATRYKRRNEYARRCKCGRVFATWDAERRECMECICTRLNRPQGQRQAFSSPRPRRWYLAARGLIEIDETPPPFGERLALGFDLLSRCET